MNDYIHGRHGGRTWEVNKQGAQKNVHSPCRGDEWLIGVNGPVNILISKGCRPGNRPGGRRLDVV